MAPNPVYRKKHVEKMCGAGLQEYHRRPPQFFLQNECKGSPIDHHADIYRSFYFLNNGGLEVVVHMTYLIHGSFSLRLAPSDWQGSHKEYLQGWVQKGCSREHRIQKGGLGGHRIQKGWSRGAQDPEGVV